MCKSTLKCLHLQVFSEVHMWLLLSGSRHCVLITSFSLAGSEAVLRLLLGLSVQPLIRGLGAICVCVCTSVLECASSVLKKSNLCCHFKGVSRGAFSMVWFWHLLGVTALLFFVMCVIKNMREMEWGRVKVDVQCHLIAAYNEMCLPI